MNKNQTKNQTKCRKHFKGGRMVTLAILLLEVIFLIAGYCYVVHLIGFFRGITLIMMALLSFITINNFVGLWHKDYGIKDFHKINNFSSKVLSQLNNILKKFSEK